MKKNTFITFGIMLSVLLIGAISIFLQYREHIFSAFIDDFEECANAGFPVQASDPPRCYVNQDNVFIRQPKNIRLQQPQEGDLLISPFELSGEARALGSFIEYELVGEEGNVLATGSLPVNTGQNKSWGTFSGIIEFFMETGEEEGTLHLFDRTKQGVQISGVTMPVRFQEEEEPIEDIPDETSDTDSNSTNSFDPLSQLQKNVQDVSQAIHLQVPFTPQAPFADWSEPFDEACEEASLIMAEYYVRGDEISLAEASSEIIAMANWEAEHNYAVDITSEQLVEVAKKYYSRDAIAYFGEQVNTENIMKLISAGYPVIIPAAGQDLGNPYFSGEGPPYHMLVITGYDQQYFFTNDPGTKRGEGYRYTHDVLLSSIHDWTGEKETIRQGQKAMIVLSNR